VKWAGIAGNIMSRRHNQFVLSLGSSPTAQNNGCEANNSSCY